MFFAFLLTPQKHLFVSIVRVWPILIDLYLFMLFIILLYLCNCPPDFILEMKFFCILHMQDEAWRADLREHKLITNGRKKVYWFSKLMQRIGLCFRVATRSVVVWGGWEDSNLNSL